MLQEQMVPTWHGDEPGARDARGQLAPRLEGNDLVVPHMHDERRRLHFGQKIGDIEIADDFEIALRTPERSFSVAIH